MCEKNQEDEKLTAKGKDTEKTYNMIKLSKVRTKNNRTDNKKQRKQNKFMKNSKKVKRQKNRKTTTIKTERR